MWSVLFSITSAVAAWPAVKSIILINPFSTYCENWALKENRIFVRNLQNLLLPAGEKGGGTVPPPNVEGGGMYKVL